MSETSIEPAGSARLDAGGDPFTTRIHARWPDMDQNGHMRTTAFLGAAEDSRMQYFAANGFTMETFVAQRIGPVIQQDELRYRAELRLLEPATIELRMAGLSDDGARFRMRNTIIRDDGAVAVTATSTGGWLDLDRRRLTAPPDALLRLLQGLARTDDFETLTSPLANRA
jgi:acyl-CoA thioester hydrolase